MNKEQLIDKYEKKKSDALLKMKSSDTIGQHWMWSDSQIFSKIIDDLKNLDLSEQRRELLLAFITELNKTKVNKYTSVVVDRFLSQQ